MQLYRHLTANHVSLSPMPFLREISMEAYLVENPDILALDEDDLSAVSIVDAEVALPGARRKRQGDGRIDLLVVYGESTAGVLELKLGELHEGHLEQLEDYLSQTDRLKEILKEQTGTVEPNFIGLLVGTSIASELRAIIEKGYVFQDVIPIAALTLSRYKGNDNNVYVATDTFFRNVSRKFDKTKYRFSGSVHGKNRLVLSVIRKYVEQHPDLTFSALQDAFPKGLQGSFGCVDTVENARKLLDDTGYKRYFLAPGETIRLVDAEVAVCTQWGIGNIGRFVEAAKQMGFDITISSL